MDERQVEQQLELAQLYDQGYRMIARLFEQSPPPNIWDIVEEEWTRMERAAERATSILSEVPGLTYTPESPLKLASVLLAAIGEFIDSRMEYVDEPWEFAQQIRDRAKAWHERVDELDDMLDAFDDDDEE